MDHQTNEHLARAVHNKLFIDFLSRSVTALSLPLSEDNGVNWVTGYKMNNKPTQIEGI